MPQRLDTLLVARGFFESRAKAREALEAGLVQVAGQTITKPAALVDENATIEAAAPYPWVSRGGVKLAAALDVFDFDPQGCVCVDVGASTGGFTHVLLSRGAALVHAIDAGHDQLHASLRDDPRVRSQEKRDARSLETTEFDPLPNAITCDVSFISLKLVLPAILPLATRQAFLVALIKPQFEVGPAFVTKGLVKDVRARDKAVADIAKLIQDAGWRIKGPIASPIKGGDGNLEYLIGAQN